MLPLVGRTPWSAADALAGLCRLGETGVIVEERVQGDPRGPGGPPYSRASFTSPAPAPHEHL
jgi:hypothetical protein